MKKFSLTETLKQPKSSLAPIAVMDSGVGGLSVLDVLVKKFPNETFIYFADTANMPYGDKSAKELYPIISQHIQTRTERHGAKFVVVACNTARAILSQEGGLEKVINPASGPNLLGPIGPMAREVAQEEKTNNAVAVLATPATVASGIYKKTFDQLSNNLKVVEISGDGLAKQIESGRLSPTHGHLEPSLQEKLKGLKAQGINTLILGCTHYPHVKKQIQAIIPGITLKNPAQAIAEAMKVHFEQRGLNTTAKNVKQAQVNLIVSGEPQAFFDTMRKLPLKNIGPRTFNLIPSSSKVQKPQFKGYYPLHSQRALFIPSYALKI